MAMKKKQRPEWQSIYICKRKKPVWTLTAWEKPDGSVAAEMSEKEGLINQQWKV